MGQVFSPGALRKLTFEKSASADAGSSDAVMAAATLDLLDERKMGLSSVDEAWLWGRRTSSSPADRPWPKSMYPMLPATASGARAGVDRVPVGEVAGPRELEGLVGAHLVQVLCVCAP
jgi:hypothetical protein